MVAVVIDYVQQSLKNKTIVGINSCCSQLRVGRSVYRRATQLLLTKVQLQKFKLAEVRSLQRKILITNKHKLREQNTKLFIVLLAS